MGNFWTDLNRMLAEYDAAEAADETERAMRAENSDYAVNGEEANLIPANFVLDAEVPVVRRYGSDDPGRVVIPGIWD